VNETFRFAKGHGTENDFVLLPDVDGLVHGELDPRLVAALCHRRAGIGGDGVIRVVRTAAYDDPHAVAARETAEWFMDYRNSDGSRSQMCGNGVRVFARYLAQEGLVDPTRPLPVGTRDGVKTVTFDGASEHGDISVDMGEPKLLADTKVSVGSHSWPARHISMGNPHAVVFVDALADAGPLLVSPTYDPEDFPHGVNVEFVVRRGERHVAMRVFERGSGETRSCGTGACAVAVAAALAELAAGSEPARHGGSAGFGGLPERVADVSYRVDVPGGTLRLTWTTEGRVLLAGPAVIVARGDITKSLASEPGAV